MQQYRHFIGMCHCTWYLYPIKVALSNWLIFSIGWQNCFKILASCVINKFLKSPSFKFLFLWSKLQYPTFSQKRWYLYNVEYITAPDQSNKIWAMFLCYYNLMFLYLQNHGTEWVLLLCTCLMLNYFIDIYEV